MTIEGDIEKEAVFDEMLRKLVNTRIQEYLSSLKQKMAANKGQASTEGQNLRDQLLTHHINTQIRVHYYLK